MGILVISRPTSIFSLTPATRSPNGVADGWWGQAGGGSSDAALLASIEASGVNGITYVDNSGTGSLTIEIIFKWNKTDPIFALDGAPAISYNDLPAGFALNGTLIMVMDPRENPNGPYRATLYRSLTQGYNVGSEFEKLETTGLKIVDDDPSVFIGAGQFILGALSLSLTSPIGANPIFATISNYVLTGLYTLYTNDWSFSPSSAFVGDRITFTADVTNPANHSFENVDRITFSYPTTDSNGASIIRNIAVYKNGSALSNDSGGGYPVKYSNSSGIPTIEPEEFTVENGPYIIEWGLYVITLIIPWGFEDYTGEVELTGEVKDPKGTQFSGSVPLGTLTISYADTSGIYAVTPNKTNDTIYYRVLLGPVDATEDVVIPIPSAKTGFVGG